MQHQCRSSGSGGFGLRYFYLAQPALGLGRRSTHLRWEVGTGTPAQWRIGRGRGEVLPALLSPPGIARPQRALPYAGPVVGVILSYRRRRLGQSSNDRPLPPFPFWVPTSYLPTLAARDCVDSHHCLR